MSEATSLSGDGSPETKWGQLRAQPWGLWARQSAAILRLDVKKALLGRRMFGIILLAALPVFMALLMAWFLPERAVRTLGGLEVTYAILYRSFMLRFVIFFGCVLIFTNLFRGDVLEKTLHYYFLAPVRREVLAFGKYLAGVASAAVIFGASAAASFLILHFAGSTRAAQDFLISGPGVWRLLAYLGVTLLGCVGYGAVFMLAGLLVRNWIIPAALIFGWESLNLFLPPVLKQISVIFYLESLCPVAIPPGPVTILADPAPLWLAVPGLAGLTAALLAVSALRLRAMEIRYSTD